MSNSHNVRIYFCLNVFSTALKTLLSLPDCVFWCFDDSLRCLRWQSLAVFLSACFLAPDNPPPLLQADVTESPVWLSFALTITEKHMAVSCIHIPLCESAFSNDILSQLEWAVCRPLKANNTVCYRSSFEVALNTCQDTSLLFFLAILTEAAAQWKLIQPS